MKTKEEIKRIGREVLRAEIIGLQQAESSLSDGFTELVKSVLGIKGRVVLSGIGKSAIIAQKVTATLNSTGTPSVFMHAAEAIHGDLGMVQEGDLILIFSHSGNTAEIKYLAELIKKMNHPLACITGNSESYLASLSNFVVDYKIEREACPLNLAPTTSTTIQLALGDALAVALLSCRNFSQTDFSKYHPGGSLGKKLYLTCGEIASQNQKPLVNYEDDIRSVILEISAKRLGATAVIQSKEIVGIITDGDIRRMLENKQDLANIRAKDIMGENPKHIFANTLAIEALEIFKTHKISQLIVLNEDKTYVGIIHLHDLNREGLV